MDISLLNAPFPTRELNELFMLRMHKRGLCSFPNHAKQLAEIEAYNSNPVYDNGRKIPASIAKTKRS